MDCGARTKDLTGRDPPSCRALLPLSIGLVAMAGLVLLLIVSTGGASAAITFEEDSTHISKVTIGVQTSVDLAIGPADQLYAVWSDGRLAAWQAGSVIFFATSEPDSRGRQFEDAVRMPDLGEDVDQMEPAIAVGPDGTIHVVWQQRSRADDLVDGPFWDIYYSRSRDGGFEWTDPIRVSQPNNRNNSAPTIAALDGDAAFVAWEMEDYPGTSIPLAMIEHSSRAWLRFPFVEATDRWEHNLDVNLAIDGVGILHVSWASVDLDGGGDMIQSQVFYLYAGKPTRTSAIDAPIPLADNPFNWTNQAPSLTLTKRHGAWVSWVRRSPTFPVDPVITVLSDSVLKGESGLDMVVGEFYSSSTEGAVLVDASSGLDDAVLLTVSDGGVLAPPPYYSEICSEFGCFSDPEVVVEPDSTRGSNASIVADSLDNIYVAWDDGTDIWIVQRRNMAPGAPELLLPDRYTHDQVPTFEWTFNDPDAAASQSSFEIQYATGLQFADHLGGVVTGALGRSSRFTPNDPIDEGWWYWRVRTRDQMGLWSPWSAEGRFLSDRTAPTGTVLINQDAEVTTKLVVVLTLNASDEFAGPGNEMYFQIANEPNFINSTKQEYPPPNRQVNHELPPGEGVKVVFMRIFDSTELHYTAMDSIIFNETPFLISHTAIATAPMNKALNVSCEVIRFHGVTTTLFFRVVGDVDFQEESMASNGSLFWAEVPKEAMTTKGLEYYINARSSGGIATSPGVDPSNLPHLVEVYETTEEYEPPLYTPMVTLIGAVLVALAMFLVWYFRLRE